MTTVEPEAFMSGWLTKQGHRVRNWKRRFFKLYSNYLVYFAGIDGVEKVRKKSLQRWIWDPWATYRPFFPLLPSFL